MADRDTRASRDRLLLAVVCLASAATLVAWCRSMAGMGGMSMPGGWTMSMMWMRMPGQTWPGAATAFLGMWIVMTAAMMVPSFEPMLRACTATVGGGSRSFAVPGAFTAGYFAVWTACGAVVYALGVGVAELTMREPAVSRLVPLASGIAVCAAGALQLTRWKARQLACCRTMPTSGLDTVNLWTAWRQGLAMGMACTRCCAGLLVIQMALGMMDLRVMAAVTVAITAERLLPGGVRVARAVGIAAMVAGIQAIHPL